MFVGLGSVLNSPDPAMEGWPVTNVADKDAAMVDPELVTCTVSEP